MDGDPVSDSKTSCLSEAGPDEGLHDLQGRWARLIGGCAVTKTPSPDATQAVFEDLAARYGEPHRAYHDLDHLRQCFRELDAVRSDESLAHCNFAAIELALWFHDAVYAPYSSKNEARSAELAKVALSRLDLDPALLAAVKRMILATRTHTRAEDLDEQLLLDCDLSILGQDAISFARYQRDVRREYKWLPDWYYRRRRRAFLVEMQGREAIFQTSPFRERYEQRARDNLARALSDLEAKERVVKIRFDEDALWTTFEGALRDRVHWDRIEQIVIKTTDRGPREDDVIWIFFGGDEGVIVGSEANGMSSLVDRLVQLPGFDHREMIDAMSSMQDRNFVVWKKDGS